MESGAENVIHKVGFSINNKMYQPTRTTTPGYEKTKYQNME